MENRCVSKIDFFYVQEKLKIDHGENNLAVATALGSPAKPELQYGCAVPWPGCKVFSASHYQEEGKHPPSDLLVSL